MSREGDSVVPRFYLLAVLLCTTALVIPASSVVSGEVHFLDYSEDNFKVVFISGNLTAAVTHDWPRVVFQHSSALLAPTFEVGIPLMYLFNDTNPDGVFDQTEMVYVSYLDAHHNVTWDVSPVKFGNETVAGEYAQFRMKASLSLFRDFENLTALVEDWANITFWFRITENPVVYSNSYGSYTVVGRTEMRMNFTLEIMKHVNVTGIALDLSLKGGGSTYMFLIKEDAGGGATRVTSVSSREDETTRGLDFTHILNQTNLGVQDIDFSKADGVVQAHYHYSSEPTSWAPTTAYATPMNSSYYTTGTGLKLNIAYSIDNTTDVIVHDSSLGLDERGFVSKVKDWFTVNMPWILIISGSIVAVVSVSILVMMLRKHRRNVPPNGKD
jgi:hypothetical protein